MVVAERFHKIPLGKLYVIELRKIKNMRFRQHGSGHVKLVTNLYEIIEKVGIGKLFGVFVNELLFDMTVGD